MHGSRSKIPNKNPVRQRCTQRFNSAVKALILIAGGKDEKGKKPKLK
jgi:hypothetical protein